MTDPNRKTRTATLADVLGAQNNMKLYTDAKLKDTIAGYHGMIASPELDALKERLAKLERPWYRRLLGGNVVVAPKEQEDAA